MVTLVLSGLSEKSWALEQFVGVISPITPSQQGRNEAESHRAWGYLADASNVMTHIRQLLSTMLIKPIEEVSSPPYGWARPRGGLSFQKVILVPALRDAEFQRQNKILQLGEGQSNSLNSCSFLAEYNSYFRHDLPIIDKQSG